MPTVATVPAGAVTMIVNIPVARVMSALIAPLMEGTVTLARVRSPSSGSTWNVAYPAEVGATPAMYSDINVSGPPVHA